MNGVQGSDQHSPSAFPQQATQPWRLRLEDALETAVRQIITGYEPERIFVFGSMARGDVHADSDIDLLIVKNTDRRFLDRISDVLAVIDVPVPVEPIVYTPDELERLQAENRDFTGTVMREARLIYDRRGNEPEPSGS